MTAELWALRDGLSLASSLNVDSLIVEVDATAFFSLISVDAQNFHSNLWLWIAGLYRRPSTSVGPCFQREQSFCRRIGTQRQQPNFSPKFILSGLIACLCYIYFELPSFMLSFINAGKAGLAMYRTCS